MDKEFCELKDKYRTKIFPCKKSISQVIEYLHQEFTLALMDSSYPSYSKIIHSKKMNCIHSHKNIELNLSYEDLDIISFVVEKDANSAIYYDYMTHNWPLEAPAFAESSLYVTIEKKMEHISSSCQELFLDLIIYKGITAYDIEHDTQELWLYLQALKLRS